MIVNIKAIRQSITTYPRKGTETVSCNRATYTRFDYNLSPQGDGNTQKVLHASWIVLLQLIPARGRKLVVIVDEVGFLGLQLIPARGRKHLTFHDTNDFHFITTYPRKGTKKPLRCWYEPVRRGFAFQGSSVLGSAGGRSGGDGRVNGNFLDVLRDVPLQGADLMQVGGDLLQGLFNVLGIQRPNALAL